MLPYFLKLDQPIISDQLNGRLVNWALNNQHHFVTHVGDEGPDGNNYFSHPTLSTLEEIQQLRSRCAVDFSVLLYLHKPNGVVIKHYDKPKYRRSSLTQPLYPKEQYAPTHFWASMDSPEPIATCDFNDGLPALVNISLVHSLVNNASTRFNLQFSFQEDFDTIHSLHLENKLFK